MTNYWWGLIITVSIAFSLYTWDDDDGLSWLALPITHCGKLVRPTCKVNGKGRILTQWYQNPLSSTPVQIFVSIRSLRASSQISEILRFCDFFSQLLGYTVFYFLGHARVQVPWMNFHDLWLVRRVFAQGRSFWGLRQYRTSFRVISPKLPKKIRIYAISSKTGRI